jgi:Rrf2 family transcriptional regulator, iron-sulfur cluster assembly transcription factor
MYNKKTETAIAAASRLAEVYDGGKTRLSVVEIATSRGLQRPFLAKVLTDLSQAGIVSGIPGPGGGFALAKHPSEIVIFDIFKIFENQKTTHDCPFGGGICGSGTPCPLHDRLVDVQQSVDRFLHETSLSSFQNVDQNRKVESHARSAGDMVRRGSFQARLEIPAV